MFHSFFVPSSADECLELFQAMDIIMFIFFGEWMYICLLDIF